MKSVKRMSLGPQRWYRR